MADGKQPWCNACRWAKMVHCDQAWHGCSGMRYLDKSDTRVQKALDPATDRAEAHKLMNEVWNETEPDPPYSPWRPITNRSMEVYGN